MQKTIPISSNGSLRVTSSVIEKELEKVDYLQVLQRKAKLNPLEKLSEPPTILEIMSKGVSIPFASLGNFSLLIGKAKSRKSFFVYLLIASLLYGKILMEKFKGLLFSGKHKIALFDTEQAPFHALQGYHRTLQTARVEDPQNYDVYSLRTFDTKTRLELIEYIIYNTDDLAIVIIDGIRDLVLDINSSEEAAFITNKLLKWSEELNIHIIAVLHQNKGDNNARGHVGTELINKAESVLSIAKDSTNNDLSIVTPEYFRGKEFEPFAFSIDTDGKPGICDSWTSNESNEIRKKDRKTPSQIADEFHLDRIKEAFTVIQFPSYNEAWRQIKTSFMPFQKITDNDAKSFLSFYQSKKWIGKIDPPNSCKKWAVYQVTLKPSGSEQPV